MLNNSSDIGIEAREAQQVDGSSLTPLQNAVNRLRRHLSRTITQPRGLYEAIIDAYGPISEPDILRAEVSQVDEAYKSLNASCSSDTETCSSHEDGQETHLDSANDRKHGAGTGGGKDGQRPRSRRSHESEKQCDTHKRSDEEWAKSILTRSTGYGCLQRNQVSKYIIQLETSVDELQREIASLSPQVNVLDQHRWILREENDTLNQKIAELSHYQLFKDDESSTLQKELQLLQIQRADQLQAQHTVPSSKEPQAVRGDEGEGTGALTIVQQGSRRTLSGKGTIKKELEGLSHVPKESSRALEKATSLTSSPISQKEQLAQAEGKMPRQLSLVKWPSTLYRSVSAIRKDVLEVAMEESAVN